MSREEFGIIERILEVPADDEGQKAATFARGLVLGALVGAAIAGSTLWQRRQANRRTPEGESGNRGPSAAEVLPAGSDRTRSQDPAPKPGPNMR